MRMRKSALSVVLSLVAAAMSFGDEVASRANAILKSKCYRCHGVEFEVPGLDVLNRESLITNDSDDIAYIKPGNLEQSLLWQRVGVDLDMPPESSKQDLTDEERKTLRQWILDGAQDAQHIQRSFITEQTVLEVIRSDLQSLEPEQRSHQRYVSLHSIHNNSRFSNSDLRLYRAAVVKLLNSVSRRSRIVRPPLVDADSESPYIGNVFRVDIRDFGWSATLWQRVLRDYPYGIAWHDNKLQALAKDIGQLVGDFSFDGIPYVRGDWLVAKAARPDVYHELLSIPSTVEELERNLGIDSRQDFLQDRLERGGFASSGVSHQNRLIDRHEGRIASYYYRSYDFDKAFGRGVLFRFPLGPRFEKNPHDEFAFEHAGGEIIWNLPNGLQGYMLIDADGNRIDTGPIDIVRDMREISGSPEIVNGISCIGCHRHGLLDYEDTVRDSQALTASARSKLERLYTSNDQIAESLTLDRNQFLAALKTTVGPYLQLAADKDKKITEFPEPVSTVASWYDRDMSIRDVSAELGIEQASALAATIPLNKRLKDLGLSSLPTGSTIPRRMWDTQEESPASVFQRTVVALGLGSGRDPNE